MEGFAKVITIADAEKNGWSLSIPLYLRESEQQGVMDTRTVAECAAAWGEAAFDMKVAYEELNRLLRAAQ